MWNLTEQEIVDLMKKIGERLGYDHTSAPIFAEGREDVAVAKHTTEDGSSYGYDSVYVMWKNTDGSICYQKILDTKISKDYLHIEEIPHVEDTELVATISSGGSFSGIPFKKTVRVRLDGLSS